MVTTGLLSLNVHDSLTFEGTELCLHPDLFSTTSNNETASFQSSAVPNTRLSNTSIKPNVLQTSATALSELMTPAPSTISDSKTLQVGDMVEIRVWDPLPKGAAAAAGGVSASSVASIVRGRPPTISAASSTSSTAGPDVARTLNLHGPSSILPHSGNNSVASDDGEETAIDVSASSTTGSGADNNSNSSRPIEDQQQQQQSSPLEPPGTSPNLVDDANASAAAPKDVITSTDLPPVAPRSRTNTADNIVRTSTVIAKPPLQRRSTATATQQAGIFTSSANVGFTRSRHHRDLSDMTADTAYGAGSGVTTSLDTSQQLVDFHLPASTSNVGDDDVDTEDLWTSHSHSLRMSFVMLVTEHTLTSLKGSARTQVSILRQVADLYQLSSYDMVSVHKVAKEEEEAALEAVSADFVTVTIKDQFISRGDMHFFQGSMIGSWVYEGQRLYEQTRGFQANAREIRHKDKQALSGIITDKTTVTFRSRSARIIWLVQISVEMWEYSQPYERRQEESMCETYFDKWIAFVHKLFSKWKQLEVSHSLTVVFFSRSFTTAGKESDTQQDVYGRRYYDHYRIVIGNETGPDWESLILRIKEAFVNYPSEVGWTLSRGDSECRPSTASQGNVLEAINVTLNLLQFHYLDRDLQRTGNSIVVVSAGNGVFEVDKGLAGISYQRMMDNGIGSDVLSLGLPALHIAPFFLYNNVYNPVEIEDVDSQEQYYEVPHWMHLSFVSYESDESVFVDHLFEAEESKEDRNPAGNFAGLEIAANGFLLPRSPDANQEDDISSSPLLRPLSFSARGNKAASPARKPKQQMSRERQLIEGRDFRDILEACRPRNAGAIPSALRAILEMGTGTSTASDEESAGNASSGSRCGLKEWGALDFDAIKNESPVRKDRRTLSLGQDPDADMPGRSPPRSSIFVQPGSSPDNSSQASSIASQISLLGISYDRPYLAHKGSPSLGAVELQRSPSLEIEVNNNEAHLNDVGNECADEGDSTQRKMKERGTDLEERLRAMMRAHDTKAIQPSPKLAPKPESNRKEEQPSVSRQGSQRTVSSQSGMPSGPIIQRRQSLTRPMPTPGGLGHALSQYRASSTASTNYPGDSDTAGSKIQRISSMGMIPANSRTASLQYMADVGSRVLSPLILPPVLGATPLESRDQFLDTGGPADIPLDRRFLQPQTFARPTGGDAFSGRNLSRSPGLPGNARISDPKSEARREGSRAPRSLSTSPPTGRAFGKSPPKDIMKPGQSWSRREQGTAARQRSTQRARSPPPKANRSGVSSRKAKILNPFRQQDEVEVLAKKSHNRRRWSHVFPLGEVEFKRHSGPNWKSLTAPAALPVVIDYFPRQEEIDRSYMVSMYNITLSEFDHKNYTSNMDLLLEMVRQRLTQDFQLVSEDYVRANNYRREMLNDGLVQRGRIVSRANSTGMIRHFLSMGHRLQILTYDPSAADIIEVTRYNAKHAQKNSIFKYHYLSYCQETKSYSRVSQTFEKYGEEYNWNKVDRLISGGDDKEMREGMRFKRIMFGIIPEDFHGNDKAEAAYVTKFRRLLEYFEKLRPKDESTSPLDIKFITSKERETAETVERIESTPGLARNSMHRFYVQLRKGQRDNLEWIEIAVDSTFDTTWSYRIMFSWLVASAGKVDTQIQLLQRRCTQYGLNLIPTPQITVSKNVYLNPFKAPAILTIRNKDHGRKLDRALTKIDFLHDGVFATDVKTILDCMEGGHEFHFERRWGIPVPGRNFVHRSGTLFVRILTDRNGLCVLIVLGNYRYMMTTKDAKIVDAYEKAYKALTDCVASLGKEEEEAPPIIEPVTTLKHQSKTGPAKASQQEKEQSHDELTKEQFFASTKSKESSLDTEQTSNADSQNAETVVAATTETPPAVDPNSTDGATTHDGASEKAVGIDEVSEKALGIDENLADSNESREELIGVPIVDSQDSQRQEDLEKM